MFVPYGLCHQIIKVSLDGNYNNNGPSKKLVFHNELAYRKTNKVPIAEYFNLIHQAEVLGYNILSVYDKKEDILLNYSNMSPQFSIFCLNRESLYLALASFVKLMNTDSISMFRMDVISREEIKVIISEPTKILKESIYLPLGSMLIIAKIVEYYLFDTKNYNITMNFVGGSQPHHERQVTKDLNCNVNFSNSESSIIIRTPDFEKQFQHYNPLLDNIIDGCVFEPLYINSDIVIDSVKIIEDVIGVIKDFYFRPDRISKCSIEYVSSKLKTPVWTLQRQLSKNKTTYSDLLDEVIIELATKFLREGQMSIREVSDYLNFSSQASFTRFFKSLTGMTPLSFKGLCE